MLLRCLTKVFSLMWHEQWRPFHISQVQNIGLFIHRSVVVDLLSFFRLKLGEGLKVEQYQFLRWKYFSWLDRCRPQLSPTSHPILTTQHTLHPWFNANWIVCWRVIPWSIAKNWVVNCQIIIISDCGAACLLEYLTKIIWHEDWI